MKQKLAVAAAVTALFGAGVAVGLGIEGQTATARAKDPNTRYLKSIDRSLGEITDQSRDMSDSLAEIEDEKLGSIITDNSVIQMLYETNTAVVGICRATGGDTGYCGSKPFDRPTRRREKSGR